MNILQELLKLTEQRLSEEAIEVKDPATVWTEGKDKSKTYISNTSYYVRHNDDNKYEVTIEDGTSRKTFTTMSKVELDKAFVPIRAKQTPDAEGYMQYRTLEEIEAFVYQGDTIKIDAGTELLLRKGDYLIKKPAGNVFQYEVKPAKNFESIYTAK